MMRRFHVLSGTAGAVLCLGLLLRLPALKAEPLLRDSQDKPEVVSLLGRPLYAAPATGEALAKLEKDLAEARSQFKSKPNNSEALILYGRSLAALWRYHEAIDVYTQGIMRWSDHALLFRHRGHRFISIREFEKAILDLVKARTLKGNDFDILYHLGLAFYLEGNYERALSAYEACLASVSDAGNSVAVRHWMFMTLRRLGRAEEAAALLEDVRPDMEVGENGSYLHLLLFYKGLKSEQDILSLMEGSHLETATLGNGLSVWYLTSGREAEARQLMEKIVSLDYWPAFGFIAAEAELSRFRTPGS